DRSGFRKRWIPLSETRREADGIASLHESRFKNVDRMVLREQEPTKDQLKLEFPKYSVLHLATHGYFAAEGLCSIAEVMNDSEERRRLESQEHHLVVAYWPSLLCGIVCAGANDPKPGGDNGLLTGDEVSGLDLGHCDLVVLSACETGLGKLAA